jgi:hypothetical protein
MSHKRNLSGKPSRRIYKRRASYISITTAASAESSSRPTHGELLHLLTLFKLLPIVALSVSGDDCDEVSHISCSWNVPKRRYLCSRYCKQSP